MVGGSEGELIRVDVVYLTSRRNSRVKWFCDGLVREAKTMEHYEGRPELRVIFVDTRLWYDDETERRAEFEAAVGGRFTFVHVSPKPSVWQGPHRLTRFDFFCAASARNTAFCYATGEHVAFADDLSCLMPGWLSGHLHAAKHHYVLCGSTNKNLEMQVDDQGLPYSYRVFPPGQDHRLRTAQRDGSIRCSGSWLFGGTFSVPLEAALRVNGQDEMHDTIGGEDYDFGIRLERSGVDVCYNRTCATMESEEAHHDEPGSLMVRIDKPVAVHGPYSSNLLYYRLMSSNSTWTMSNRYVLRDLRAAIQRGEPFPVPREPDRHWVDDQLLTEMYPTIDGYYREGRDPPSVRERFT